MWPKFNVHNDVHKMLRRHMNLLCTFSSIHVYDYFFIRQSRQPVVKVFPLASQNSCRSRYSDFHQILHDTEKCWHNRISQSKMSRFFIQNWPNATIFFVSSWTHWVKPRWLSLNYLSKFSLKWFVLLRTILSLCDQCLTYNRQLVA